MISSLTTTGSDTNDSAGGGPPITSATITRSDRTSERCIAAPVFDWQCEAVAGLSVSGPAFRIGLSDTTRLGQMVRAAADQVTAATGGIPGDGAA